MVTRRGVSRTEIAELHDTLAKKSRRKYSRTAMISLSDTEDRDEILDPIEADMRFHSSAAETARFVDDLQAGRIGVGRK